MKRSQITITFTDTMTGGGNHRVEVHETASGPPLILGETVFTQWSTSLLKRLIELEEARWDGDPVIQWFRTATCDDLQANMIERMMGVPQARLVKAMQIVMQRANEDPTGEIGTVCSVFLQSQAAVTAINHPDASFRAAAQEQFNADYRARKEQGEKK